MMQQQYSQPTLRPKRFDVFLHGRKTFKLIGALMADKRISTVRKVLFVSSIVVLLVILVFPDTFGEVFLSTVLPLLGTVLGIPIDAGFDWLAFALLLVNLLRFFPNDIVSEHYQDIFEK